MREGAREKESGERERGKKREEGRKRGREKDGGREEKTYKGREWRSRGRPKCSSLCSACHFLGSKSTFHVSALQRAMSNSFFPSVLLLGARVEN